MKIPLKFKVPKQGEYQPDCSSCPDCGWSSWRDESRGSEDRYFLSFLGLTDEFIVRECPMCGTKFHYHHRGNDTWITTMKNKHLILSRK